MIRQVIHFVWEEWLLVLMAVLSILCFAFIGLMVYASIQNEAAWRLFAQANGCKVVETIPGTVGTSTGVGVTTTNGQVTVAPVVTTTIIPDRNKWVCRDESVHWR